MSVPKGSAQSVVRLVTHDLVDKSQGAQYRRWFESVLVPRRLNDEGCVSCQLYGLVLGELPTHLVVSEYRHVEATATDVASLPGTVCDGAEWPHGVAPIFSTKMDRCFRSISHHRAESAAHGPIVGGAMLMVLSDIDRRIENEFDEWYEQEHIPERLALEGSVAARRYVALKDTPKFLAIWEVASLDDFTRPDYRFKLPNPPTAWTNRMRREMSQTRGVYNLVGDYR